MTVLSAKTSLAVRQQLPDFVVDNNELFVNFMEAYYEFLEQSLNPNDVIQNILDYADIDKTIEQFFSHLQNSILQPLPKNLLVDKVLLAKHIKEFYSTIGTEKSYKLLFRILFNDEIEFYYPKTDILKPSSGRWHAPRVIRITDVTGNPFSLLGQQVFQINEATGHYATSNIENVLGNDLGYQIYECTLNEDSKIGEFNIYDKVFAETDQFYGKVILENEQGYLENEDGYYLVMDNYIESSISEIMSDILVTNSGKYYESGDRIYFKSNEYYKRPPFAEITQIDPNGSIEGFIIVSQGTGYAIGDSIIFSGGEGSDANAVISKITPTGGILEITIKNSGKNYKTLPNVTIKSYQGTGGKLLAKSNSIGRVTKVSISDFGYGYTYSPIVYTTQNLIINRIEDPIPDNFIFDIGYIVKSSPNPLYNGKQITGVVYDYNPSNQLIKISLDIPYDNILTEIGDIIIQEDNSLFLSEYVSEFLPNTNIEIYPPNYDNLTEPYRYTIYDTSLASFSPVLSAEADYSGVYLNDDGKLDESNKKIADGYYYQDFSYVIKSGQSLNDYISVLKSLVHPAGLKVFSETKLNSTNNVNVRLLYNKILLDMNNLLNKFILNVQGIVEIALQNFYKQYDKEFPPTILDKRVNHTRTIIDINQTYLRYYVEVPSLGPKAKDLEKFKFFYPPYNPGIKNSIFSNTNGVYNTFIDKRVPSVPPVDVRTISPNTPISVFKDYKIFQVCSQGELYYNQKYDGGDSFDIIPPNIIDANYVDYNIIGLYSPIDAEYYSWKPDQKPLVLEDFIHGKFNYCIDSEITISYS